MNVSKRALFCLLLCPATVMHAWSVFPSKSESKQTKPAPPGVSEPHSRNAQFQVYGDFLWWQASVSRLPYIVEAEEVSIPEFGVSIANHEKIKEVHFDYDPGFRVGIGTRYDTGWDMQAEWVRFYTIGHAHKRADADDDRVIAAIWDIYLAENKKVRASESVRLNQVNLNFVKNISLGTHFSLDPYFGGTGAWLDEYLKMRFKQTFEGEGASARTKIRNTFEGGGLEVGMTTSYDPARWFSLYAKGSYGLLYGKFKFRKHSVQRIDSELFGPLKYDHHQSAHELALVNTFDIMTGLKFHWASRHWAFSFHVGYEFDFWPGQIRGQRLFTAIIPTGSTPTILSDSQGDVGFQGFNAGAYLSF